MSNVILGFALKQSYFFGKLIIIVICDDEVMFTSH